MDSKGSSDLSPFFYLVRGELDLAVDGMEKGIADHEAIGPIFLASALGKKILQCPRWPTLARMMNLPDDTNVTT